MLIIFGKLPINKSGTLSECVLKAKSDEWMCWMKNYEFAKFSLYHQLRSQQTTPRLKCDQIHSSLQISNINT